VSSWGRKSVVAGKKQRTLDPEAERFVPEQKLECMAIEAADLIADNLDAEQMQRLVLLLSLKSNKQSDVRAHTPLPPGV